MIPSTILQAFNLRADDFTIDKVHAGYINQTYKISGAASSYILQQVNKNVFKQPDVVAKNIRLAAEYIRQHDRSYVFLASLKTIDDQEMAFDDTGFPWRLFPFIPNTVTINKVSTEEEAFYGASGFARLTRKLDGCDTTLFKPTIDRFHDLQWRYEQFEDALSHAAADRKQEAHDAIQRCLHYKYLADRYRALIAEGHLTTRILHNDTKINNILFDSTSRKDVCVIDLDTLMPGYFIYDLGDMVRTFTSPVDEEEQDLDKVVVRPNIYEAIIRGYLSEMNDVLSDKEKEAIPFAGLMMTYIMALRMLADFLNGDIYYHTTYPKQNLIRARNQLRLLDQLNQFHGG